VACVAFASCDGARRETEIPEEEPAPASIARFDVPEALLVRFERVSGTGFSRQGWELEVLQMGSDIRVRGSIREQGTTVPVFRPMDAAEFAEFWSWIKGFPLDGFQVRADQAAPESGWRKRLKFDAVVGTDRRMLSDNEWTHPALDAHWLDEIENRLHSMVVELAERELAEPDSAEAPTGAGATMQRAWEALGEEPPAAGTTEGR
jgi:hypothetical protein